ncbi:hypothetical protein ON010_g7525 [Phytophthora cinnamomi]|nr:hypothetical protein ON010_g7525 [Phytophthora cinnamomi]
MLLWCREHQISWSTRSQGGTRYQDGEESRSDGTARLDGTLCQSAELAELAGFTGALRPTDWESRASETKDGWRHARGRRTAVGRPDDAGHGQKAHKRTKREPGEPSSTQPSRRDSPSRSPTYPDNLSGSSGAAAAAACSVWLSLSLASAAATPLPKRRLTPSASFSSITRMQASHTRQSSSASLLGVISCAQDRSSQYSTAQYSSRPLSSLNTCLVDELGAAARAAVADHSPAASAVVAADPEAELGAAEHARVHGDVRNPLPIALRSPKDGKLATEEQEEIQEEVMHHVLAPGALERVLGARLEQRRHLRLGHDSGATFHRRVRPLQLAAVAICTNFAWRNPPPASLLHLALLVGVLDLLELRARLELAVTGVAETGQDVTILSRQQHASG